MAFCKNCGTELEENVSFCKNCGSAQTEAAVAKTKSVQSINVPYLVWSIINILFLSTLFGIIALVFTILAAGKPYDEAMEKLKLARIFNLIATILGGVSILWVFIIVFFVIVFYVLIILGIISSAGTLALL